GAGAGDQVGGEPDGGFLSDGSPIEGGNNPDGEGEEPFEQVYAPQRVGGESDQSIFLEPDDENSPLIEGDFSENPTGNASIPYNQVYSDYNDAARQALESDYIPLGVRDVVRDYFTSIEPGQ
ncbi:MAG: hypothetical protein ACOYL5_08950, partial [Phototrophicaceae bacterium]